MITSLQTLYERPLIPIFMIANLSIGLWAYIKAKKNSFEDYSLSSNRLPAGVLLMTILATMISDRELTIIDATFEFGIIVSIVNTSFYAMGMFFVGLVIAPRLVFYDSPTMGGVMRTLYGKGAQLLTGFIHCVFSLLLLITLIASIGIIGKQLLGLNFTAGVLFFGIIVVLYSTLGGMRSVSYTDVLQLIAVLFVAFWVAHKVMIKSGGILALINKVNTNHPQKLAVLKRPDLFPRLKANLCAFLACYLVLSPPLVHRMLIVKDKSKVRRTWYTSAFVYAVIMGMLLIPCLFVISQQKTGGLVERKDVFIKLVKNLFKNNSRIADLMALGIIGILLSTMDSLLHTMGITAVKDLLEPIQALMGKKKLNQRQQVNYSKIVIFIIGTIAVVIASQVSYESSRYIRRALIGPIRPLTVLITIPFVLGVIGLKTDKYSFISYLATYLVVFYGQTKFFPWREALGHRAHRDYFLVTLPISILAYMIAHIVVNRGIATVKRGKNYTAQETWNPSVSITTCIMNSLKAFLNLPQLAHKEISKRPSHSLVFSIFMFALYALSSGIGVGKDSGVADFMAVIYLVGVSLCVGLMLEGVWPYRLKRYFPVYWFTTLFLCLPVGATLTFLRSNEGYANIFFIGSFVLLAFLVSSRTFFWMTFLGSLLAWGGWYSFNGSFPEGLWNENYVRGYIELAILLLCVLFFGHYFETYNFKPS